MRYKVGDKVRVRKDLNEGMTYNEFAVTTPMADKAGDIVTISAVSRWYYHIAEYGCCWTDEMFEGLVEEELTAEEAIRILGEICCENKCYNGCPIGKARGKMSCHFFRRDKPKEVIEILKQFKKDREKKEVETEITWCVLIIEADTNTLKHEEKVGTDFKSIDAKKAEILKKYCSEHDGKYYAISERRCVVKE